MATLVLVISIAYLLIYVTFVYEVKPGPQVIAEVPSPHMQASSRDAVESVPSNPELPVLGPVPGSAAPGDPDSGGPVQIDALPAPQPQESP